MYEEAGTPVLLLRPRKYNPSRRARLILKSGATPCEAGSYFFGLYPQSIRGIMMAHLGQDSAVAALP